MQFHHRLLAPCSLLLASALSLLSGCGSGGSSGSSGPTALTNNAASQFLSRSTFGPSPESIARLSQVGYEQWLRDQEAIGPTLLVPELLQLGCSNVDPNSAGSFCLDFIVPHTELRNRLLWKNAVYAPDQLRQRLAFALSEIFVVSHFNATLERLPVLVADYYDTLALGSFGTYRELLEEITLHPAMGIYLSMLLNRKADPILGTRPDENFAREVMQLFSIGLVQLDSGGQPILGADGLPIPTYSQSDIEELSRVFTGWTYATLAPKTNSLEEFFAQPALLGRMQAWPAFHDDGPKELVGGFQIQGGLTPEQDLSLALDALANHPNTGPFICKQLIQRLVTSNPSASYVSRASAVFDNNGSGVRGDLGAVFRAILMDPEALGTPESPETFGKVREPILRTTALFRAFEAIPPPGNVLFEGFESRFFIGQQALYSPSVFNFFSPSYATQALESEGLVAPELQISTHSLLTNTANLLQFAVFAGNTETADQDWVLPLVDLEPVRALSQDIPALLDLLDTRLLNGSMSPEMRDLLVARLLETPYEVEGYSPGLVRAIEAISVIVTTPEFIVQR